MQIQRISPLILTILIIQRFSVCIDVSMNVCAVYLCDSHNSRNLLPGN